MPNYEVSAKETIYYLTKDIKAKNIVEAKEKYKEMMDEGNVEVAKCFIR